MEFLQQMAAAALVLGLLGAVLWFLRRRGWAAPAGKARHRLEALERLPLGPNHALHLVRLGPRTLLVASSPAGCALIEAVPSGEFDPGRGENP